MTAQWKKTGRSTSHHIIPDGVFLTSCRKLVPSDFVITWLDEHLPAEPESQAVVAQALKDAGIEYQASPAPIAQLPEEIKGKTAVYRPTPKKAPTREKLTCPQCANKAWVSPETKIICGVCNVAMQGGGSE